MLPTPWWCAFAVRGVGGDTVPVAALLHPESVPPVRTTPAPPPAPVAGWGGTPCAPAPMAGHRGIWASRITLRNPSPHHKCVFNLPLGSPEAAAPPSPPWATQPLGFPEEVLPVLECALPYHLVGPVGQLPRPSGVGCTTPARPPAPMAGSGGTPCAPAPLAGHRGVQPRGTPEESETPIPTYIPM